MTPIYSISVLCFNRRAMTARCLRSVLDHSPEATEIIVTDNGSRDGTADMLLGLAAGDGRISVITTPTNEGIPGPKRRACDRARGEFFVSLDNDAWVGPGWIERMRAPFDNDPAVMQVGRTGQHQTLHPNGVGFPGAHLDYIDGSCFMVRTSFANEIGLCDPFFPFAYADDSDFSLRVRARGFKIATVPTPVWHLLEHQKERHGGIDLSKHHTINSGRFATRWRDYLRRRAFDPTIAIRRTSAYGDVMVASGIVKRLKALWPSCRIFFCTDLPAVLDGNPLIESILPASEWKRLAPRMAYAWDLDGAYEHALNIPYWQSFVRATGLFDDQEPMRPDLYVTETARSAAAAIFDDDARIAAVCATPTTWPGKNIDPAVWRPALTTLKARGYVVVEIGTGPPAFDGLADINLVGRTTFGEMAAIIARASIFLGPDSAPYHVAEAFGIPTFAFFGCTAPAIVSAHPAVHPIQATGLDCLGCHHRQRPGTTSFQGCERNDFACRGIDPASVVSALEGVAL